MDRLAALWGTNTQQHNFQINVSVVTALDVMDQLMDAHIHVRAILEKCAEVNGAILSTCYEKSKQRVW